MLSLCLQHIGLLGDSLDVTDILWQHYIPPTNSSMNTVQRD